MSERYEIASLDEIASPPLVNSPPWSRIRVHFDIRSFGVNAWRAAEAGQELISEHDEVGDGGARHEELYVVLSGRAAFTVDGDSFEAKPGAVVFVRDPAVRRKATAVEPATRILAIGAPRGEAFTPSGWERSAPAFPLFAAGEYDKAADLLEQVRAEHPEDGAVLYNLACAESMRGRTDVALDRLSEAIAQGERFRELARKDTDFEPIRDEPRFRELVGPPD